MADVIERPQEATDTIDGDPAYPIYRIDAWWFQDCEDGGSYPDRWVEDAPEGKFRNSGGRTLMMREEVSSSDLRDRARKWWEEMIREERRGSDPRPLIERGASDPVIIVTGPRYETWCLSWFEHWTFDDGRTDEEFLESFERYVRRHERYQDWPHDAWPDDGIPLMGAEDRWRWHGAEPDGDPKSESDPPCRCEHCQEQGKVRIAH